MIIILNIIKTVFAKMMFKTNDGDYKFTMMKMLGNYFGSLK